jgi:hypothetical protein
LLSPPDAMSWRAFHFVGGFSARYHTRGGRAEVRTASSDD